MAENVKLTAEPRESFGKGAARKLRAAHKIPAVLYGHGTEPQHLSLPGHETMLAVRRANAVIELDISGRSQLALVKDVQKDPVKQAIEHIDLVIIRRGEKVTVDVAVHVEGDAAGDTRVALESSSLSLLVSAIAIPDRLVVDVTDKEAGYQVFAKDVELPEGAELVTDPETLVVNVTVAEEIDTEGAAEPDTASTGAEAAASQEPAEAE